jgi:hypothetical protein
MTRTVELVKDYDKNGDGRLDKTERDAARAAVPRGGGMRRPGGEGGESAPPTPGVKISPKDVKPVNASVPLYDEGTLRTLFLTFDDPAWEDELDTFSRTDVEVQADLSVDGKTYKGVGVGFRGASSLFMVGKGQKRSLNISIDHTDSELRLLGYKTLNLLNAHEDPTLMHSVLFARIARDYVPTPKCNFVRVVINGENWGVYSNAQQFDKTFIDENLPGDTGARWKVPGSPQGDGGLRWLGDDLEAFKSRYTMKSGKEKDWKALMDLCRTLDATPPENLEAALAPLLDIDNVLRFLAVDITLVNNDGYWTRASDYSIFRGKDGRFRIFPHDMNETFAMQAGMRGPGGRGGPGGPGGFGPPGRPDEGGPPGGPPPGDGPPSNDGPRPPQEGSPPATRPIPAGTRLDPLLGMNDARKPLRSKLLAVPALRERYLGYVKDIATRWLDWNTLSPIVAGYRTLIDADVKIDTRRLSGYDIFRRMTADEPSELVKQGRRSDMSLRAFATARRDYLLGLDAVKAAPLPKR